MRPCTRCENVGDNAECVCGTYAFELGCILAAFRIAREAVDGAKTMADALKAAEHTGKLYAVLGEAEAQVFRRMRENETAARGRAPIGKWSS